MSVSYNGTKPGPLWYMRKRTGAFFAACKDKSTRHIARVMRRDAALSTTGFVTAGLFLKVSATAITGFIFSYGLPVAAGAGVLMGAKSYMSYRKSAKSGKKSTHVRDGLIAVGAIGVGVFLLSSGAAAVVAMAVGIGAPVAAGTGVLFAAKSWMASRKLGNSAPAYNYMRKAEQTWLDKKERAPLGKRIGAAIGNAVGALNPLRLFGRKTAEQDSTQQDPPALVQQGSTPALESTAAEDFAKSAPAVEQDPQRAAAAAARAEARQRRQREGNPRFN